jgi:hypothetical protein
MSTSTSTGGAVRRSTVPTPRPARDDAVDAVVLEPVERQPEQSAPELPEPRYPWVEPWGSYRGARPRSEYWDVATASWRSRGPYPKD